MAWHSIKPPETIVITRKVAANHAAMPVLRDRPFNAQRAAMLRTAIESGTFRSAYWATCRCLETGLTYRVNGQHTSRVISEMESPPQLWASLDQFEADTMEDVAELAATIDSRRSSRTNSDVNAMFAASVPDLAEFSPRFVSLVVTGLAFYKWGESYASHPPEDRAALLLGAVEFAQWVSERLIAPSQREANRMLYRGPVVAAMYATWLKSRKDATAFWDAVRDETGQKPNLPDRKLGKWLSTMHVNNGQGASAATARRAKQREFYTRCIHAWNAWRTGAETDLKYYPSAKTPTAK